MLTVKKNLIKIPVNCNFNFLVCFKKKFLVIHLLQSQSNEIYYILIPDFIRIVKIGLFFSVNVETSQKSDVIDLFFKYFQNLLINFRLKSFKQLLLLGLGLKITLENSILLMRLGFSHINSVANLFYFLSNFIITKVGLKGFLITFYGFNKIKLGNIAEKLFKLRPADCYKNRGFSYKNKPNILKIVKKK